MILRQTIISECWCEKCHEGQMQQLQDILMNEKAGQKELIGRKLVCANCGHENTIEDVMVMHPATFIVSAKNKASQGKSNIDMYKWLTT